MYPKIAQSVVILIITNNVHRIVAYSGVIQTESGGIQIQAGPVHPSRGSQILC